MPQWSFRGLAVVTEGNTTYARTISATPITVAPSVRNQLCEIERLDNFPPAARCAMTAATVGPNVATMSIAAPPGK